MFHHANTRQALAFLQRYSGFREIVLTSIEPRGSPPARVSRTFRPLLQHVELKDWLDARQGSKNVYFGVNPTIHPVQGAGMASHDDVRGVIALHVDLDPRLHTNRIGERRRMLSRLRRYSPPPSIIVDSGAGYHGFWLLDREYEKIDPASGYSLELFNVRLARQLDGDFCHHINGLMRVPGMINIPNALKASLGRVPSVAKLVEYHEMRRYPLHLFAPAEVLEEEELASDSFVGSDQDAEGFTLVSPEECPF